MNVIREQSGAGSELTANLSFCSHPHILHVLRVHFAVSWVNEISLVNYNVVRVDPPTYLINFPVRCPSIRHNVTPRQNVLANFGLQSHRSSGTSVRKHSPDPRSITPKAQ